MSNSRAEREALKLLDSLGIKEPPVNPVQIAEGLEIQIEFVTFSDERKNISGFYDCDSNRIYVNLNDPAKRQTFTIAHELGHTLLHKEWAASNEYKVLLRDADLQGTNPQEREANVFAANLLMPRFMMDRYYDSLSVSDLSRLFAVSVPAIKARLSYLYGIS